MCIGGLVCVCHVCMSTHATRETTRRVQLYVQIHRPRTARAGVCMPCGSRVCCAASACPWAAGRSRAPADAALGAAAGRPRAPRGRGPPFTKPTRIRTPTEFWTAVHLVCNSHPYSPLRLHVLWGVHLSPSVSRCHNLGCGRPNMRWYASAPFRWQQQAQWRRPPWPGRRIRARRRRHRPPSCWRRATATSPSGRPSRPWPRFA